MGEVNDIRGWRELIADLLRQELYDESLIVTSPDHPLLMLGPDLLVASPGSLTAIFIPSSIEDKSPKRFETRVKLARAALPSHTVFVGGATSSAISSEFWRLFLEVSDEIRIYPDKELSEDRVLRTSVKSIVPALNRKRNVSERNYISLRHINKKFSSLLRINSLTVGRRSGRFDNKGEGARYSIRPGGSPAHHESFRYIRKIEASDVFAAIRNTVYSPLAPDWLHLEGDFVEYSGSSIGVIGVERFPELSSDPEKYLRAASFSGWVGVNGPEDWAIIDRFKRTLA